MDEKRTKPEIVAWLLAWADYYDKQSKKFAERTEIVEAVDFREYSENMKKAAEQFTTGEISEAELERRFPHQMQNDPSK